MVNKDKKHILPIEVRSSSELKKHTAGPGKRYVFCDNKNNPLGNLYCILREVENVNQPESHVGKHSHNCDSLWLFIGNKKNLRGLKFEVTLDKKKYILNSPASIYVPKKLKHTYRFISGSGKYINIVLAKGGRYNTATK